MGRWADHGKVSATSPAATSHKAHQPQSHGPSRLPLQSTKSPHTLCLCTFPLAVGRSDKLDSH